MADEVENLLATDRYFGLEVALMSPSVVQEAVNHISDKATHSLGDQVHGEKI